MIKMIKALFDGKIQFSNTKTQSLINSGIIMNCTKMQKYLKDKIHSKLDITNWIIAEKLKISKNKKGIGNIILNKLRQTLQEIIINNTLSTTQKISYFVSNNDQNGHTQKLSANMSTNMFSHIDDSGNNDYSGYHGVTNSVSGIV